MPLPATCGPWWLLSDGPEVPRRRYVGPDFWDSPVAVAVGYGARLTLLGCWTLADDEGLLAWEPGLIRELLFASDRDICDADVAAWMKELVTAEAVVPFYGGRKKQRLGYLLGFERAHRTGRPKPSSLPAPPTGNQRILSAYLARDAYTCHLCEGPIPAEWATDAPGTSAVPSAAEPGEREFLVEGIDLSPVVDRIVADGTKHPSNVRCTHGACAALRGALSASEAASTAAIVQVGVVARRHASAVATGISGATLAPSAGQDGESATMPATMPGAASRALSNEGAARSSQTLLSGVCEGPESGLADLSDDTVSTPATTPVSTPVSAPVSTPVVEVVAGPDRAVSRPQLGIAALTEPDNAELSEFVVSPALPESRPLTIDSMSAKKEPLTCGNADSLSTHYELSEFAMSAHDGLTTRSLTEVEVEVEKEVEVEVEGLRASRACAAATDDFSRISRPNLDTVAGAYGAGQKESVEINEQPTSQALDPTALTSTPTDDDSTPHRAHDRTHDDTSTRSEPLADDTSLEAKSRTAHTSDLSGADVVLASSPSTPHTGGEEVNAEESLFDVPAAMVQAPASLAPVLVATETLSAEERDAVTKAAERTQQATDLLNEWWVLNGPETTQSYEVIHRAIVHALSKGLVAATITRKLDEHISTGQRISNASLGPKKPSPPAYATEARKEQTHALLRPWWGTYGKGWPQTYAIVHRVVVSLLANGMSEDEVKQALRVLGPERKPISGGTVGFALSKTTKQVAEETAFQNIAASRSAAKFTQRTM